MKASITFYTLDRSTIFSASRAHYIEGISRIGPFEISSQYRSPLTPRDPIDVVALFTVEIDKHPVLFIEVKVPAPIVLDAKPK
jgi:hypothetical protein